MRSSCWKEETVMALDKRSYAGNILFVDLDPFEAHVEPLREDVAALLLGGRGIATWLWYTLQPPKADPLGPDNLLIVGTGPLTGTPAPTSGRYGLVTKSPVSRGILDSYSGGPFGQALKFAGYDFLVVRGTAPEPSILVIQDDRVQLDPAGAHWGQTIGPTERALKETYGKQAEVMLIGPAGEWGSWLSGICSRERITARGGSGAVMGSKRLKAIVASGSGGVHVHDPEGFQEGLRLALRALRMSSPIARLGKHGTTNILELIDVAGALPTRNFQAGQFEEAEKLYGERWRAEIWSQDVACWGCPIHCSKIAKHGDYMLDGPDYETIYSFGSSCGIGDKWAIVEANHICDEYGLDTISAGNVIGFVMELYQRGYVTADDLDGITPTWGDTGAMLALLDKMARGEGFGRLMGMGTRELSKHYPGSEDFAMQVKGLEMPAYHPNAAKGTALAYAISERGACHLRGAPLGELFSGAADPLTIEGKPQLFRDHQAEKAVWDSACLCIFPAYGMTLKELWQLIKAATGFDYPTVTDLERVGERISTLARLFNVREGFSRPADTLPARNLVQPMTAGPAAGQVVELEPMLDEYYRLMGWDKDGVPTEARVADLSLDKLLG
jgi:aldehyde:ferredoxin oxidoreductase